MAGSDARAKWILRRPSLFRRFSDPTAWTNALSPPLVLPNNCQRGPETVILLVSLRRLLHTLTCWCAHRHRRFWVRQPPHVHCKPSRHSFRIPRLPLPLHDSRPTGRLCALDVKKNTGACSSTPLGFWAGKGPHWSLMPRPRHNSFPD